MRKTAREMPVSEIRGFRLKDMNLGEHAMAGTLRFFASGNLPATQEAEDVLRRYFEAALITETVIQRYHEQFSPEVAVFHHGIYVPQGVIGEVCRAHGTRVANWQVGYRKKTFIFSHKETYHHTLINESTDCWTDVPWSEATENEIMSYLKSRWYGSNDWIWFHDQPKHDAELIAKETGIDFSKPTISLLTNVFWDAQLHFKANAFRDMLDWVLQSIEYFKGRPDLQLAIRIHPAEVRGAIPSRQPLVDEIRKVYPTLPDNVYVIPPDSQVSTYVLCENSDTVVIYGTKTGVELTAMGIPVVVAGEAWIRNKGLTMDATSPENYFDLLDRLPVGKRLDADTINRARKYAFHFFFRRFIPIEFMEPSSNDAPYEIRINDLQDLLPGRDAGLDVLCNGILDGSEFVYPAEKYIGRTQ
ncbi:capsule biosynthesis protein [Rhizobium leguminosarum]|nr:capsule biosynthesis protein [Rhizobium leguminosarum]MBY5744971.1 capsule biosynthesis protein [Rhizobium leguminosarum]RWY72854.1 capsule biosynthesis protein [Rhizobium leguminosarum]